MDELQTIQDKIYEIRGQRVMLDRDLAELYGVETKILNKAVKRNIGRFPDRFCFQLSGEEFANLKFQFGTSSWGGTRKLPYAFTEQGVSMLSAVLRSTMAVQVCVRIMDAFVSMKGYLSTCRDAPSATLPSRVDELEHRLALLEQSHLLLPLAAAESPLPTRLSDGVKVWIYSERALLILTENPEDRRLLRSIGARYNNWLTLKGEPVSGWVFPWSRQKMLEKYLPEKACK